MRVILLMLICLFLNTPKSAEAGWLGDWLGFDDFNKRLEELNKQLTETRKNVVELGYDAVPGAWWNKLVRDLHSDNPAAKQAAQNFLKNIAKIDIDNDYEVRIWFGMPATEEIEFDFFLAGSPHPVEVLRYLNNKSYTDRYTKSNVIPQLLGDAERKKLVQQMSELFNQTFQPELIPEWNQEWPGPKRDPSMTRVFRAKPVVALSQWAVFQQSGSNAIAGVTGGWADTEKYLTLQKNALADKLANGLVSAFFPVNPLVAGNLEPQHVKPFKPAAGTPYLFVLMPKKQWEKYKDSKQECRNVAGAFPSDLLCINVVLNQVGSPNKTFEGMRPYTFAMTEFDNQRPLPHPKRDGEELVFAVHNLVDSRFLDVEQFNRLKKIQEETEKYANNAR
jgi:hypothetical protein